MFQFSQPESSDSENDEPARGVFDLLVDSIPIINVKKQSKKEVPPMYPCFEEKCKIDPYGELIK